MKIWKDLLVSYFVNIKNYEEKIAPLRTELSQQQNFSLESLFQSLDQNSKNFISLSDLIKFCNENNVQYDEKYLRRFIRNFDKDNDFSLNFDEFKSFLLISNDQVNNEKSEVNNENNEKKEISNEIKNIFAQILSEEINLIKDSNEIAQKIRDSQYFTTYESFIEIAGNEKYITEDSLYSFLFGNNVNINTDEVRQLMYRLDSDKDGKISFGEYQEIFFPLSEKNNYISNSNINNNFGSSYNKFDNLNFSQNSNLGDSNRLLTSNIFESPEFQTSNKLAEIDYNKNNNDNGNYENPDLYNTRSIKNFSYRTYKNGNYDNYNNENYENNPMSKSMISLKNYKQNWNESNGDLNTNANSSMRVSDKICHCCCCYNCCCCIPTNLRINIIPIHSPNRYNNNSLLNSCESLYNSRNFNN